MSTTRDWMRNAQAEQPLEPRAKPLKGVLIWVAVVALATYAALAIQQTIG